MSAVKRPVMRYYGGKWKLAPWIIQHFPPHQIYTESYGGGASILLRKSRTYAEIYNDLSGRVCSVFRVLRNPAQARELARLLHLTPYAREEFELSRIPDGDPIEQARRTIVESLMGYSSASINSEYGTGFRSNTNRAGTTVAHDWANYPAHIPLFTARLRGVVIENRPAIDVIQAHDRADCLHYVDPPYLKSTRTSRGDCYEFEMTPEEHADLATVLRAVKGMVVLSGYASPLYDNDLYPDWLRIERSGYADGAKKCTEVLWLNPAAASRQQQSMEIEANL